MAASAAGVARRCAAAAVSCCHGSSTSTSRSGGGEAGSGLRIHRRPLASSSGARRPAAVASTLAWDADPLFLALAPACARARFRAHAQHFTTSAGQQGRRQAAAGASSRSYTDDGAGPSHARDDSFADALAIDVATMDTPAKKRATADMSYNSSLAHLQTRVLNNYLLALGREYRTPPPAYVFEAVRVLRDVTIVQAAQEEDRVGRGPDRQTYEIVLDMIARAIPLHTELSRTLAKDKRKAIQKEDKQPAQRSLTLKYGLPRRLLAFTDNRVPAVIEHDASTKRHQRDRLENFAKALNTFLNKPRNQEFIDKRHFFLQAAETIAGARDAESATYHPVPSRSRKDKHAAAAAAAKDGQPDSTADSEAVQPKAQQAPPPKPLESIFLSLFEDVYRFMVERTSTRNVPARDYVIGGWRRPPAENEAVRKWLVRAGRVGPLGPTMYAYAARALCYQRVREWDEVRATVRECLARAYWVPPLLEHTAHHHVGGRARRFYNGSPSDPRSVQDLHSQPVPQGWTEDAVERTVARSRNHERSMLNIELVTQILWGWVRIQAPNAPFHVPLEDVDLMGGDDDDLLDADLNAAREAAPPGFDAQLPDASPLSAPDKDKDALSETVRRVRDVYDLLRDNSMLQEWELMNEDDGVPGQQQGGAMPVSSGVATFQTSGPPGRHRHAGSEHAWWKLENLTQNTRADSDLNNDLARLARVGRKWSRDKLWLEQMRVLLLWDRKMMKQALAQSIHGRAKKIALPDDANSAVHGPTPKNSITAFWHEPDATDDEIAEEAAAELNPKRKARSSYEKTLRAIFGIPTHPAIRPHLPPHIVPDEVTYIQFVRLFTHLGDWHQAVEVLADYEQTPLPSAARGAEANSEDRDVDGEPALALPRQGQTPRVINEVSLPMFDAFFHGFCLHSVPPTPNTAANVFAELTRIRKRVNSALRALGLDDESEPVEALDVSALLGRISPQGRGWTLESLVFLLEAFLRVRADSGASSVRKRREARERAYQASVAKRRRAQRPAAPPSGSGMTSFAFAAGEGEPAQAYEGAASPTPEPADEKEEVPGPNFFERNAWTPEQLRGLSFPENAWPVRREDVRDEDWIGPVGHGLLDRIYGALEAAEASGDGVGGGGVYDDEGAAVVAPPFTSRLQVRLPDRLVGTRPSVLEVDAHGRVHGFHPAPVPRQLFWLLTALRRATSDHAPDWVLEQWTRLLDKFGPDRALVEQLWEEEARRMERRRQRMHLRPEEGRRREEEEEREEEGDHLNGEAGTKELFGTGQEGSVVRRTGARTDANREGWYGWKFPQRRSNRVLQYLAMRSGLDADSVRYG